MNLRKHLEQQHQQLQVQPAKKRAKSKRASASIVKHKSFVPMLTVWGTALFGLAVLVLPADLISRVAALTGIGALAGIMRIALAVFAAILGGGLAYVVAAAIREKTRKAAEDVAVISAVRPRKVRPIDPSSELGSDSLDAPLDATPFSSEEEEGEYFELTEGATSEEPAPETDNEAKPQPTLGELSKRGYEIEEPANSAEQEAEKPSFTRSHFKTALIESCEGATCEAAPTDQTAPSPEQNGEQEQSDVTPLLAKKPKAAEKRPIGRPGSNGVWSLTQFEPEQKPEPPKVSEPVATLDPAPEPKEDLPRELNLAEFAKLPGRNAVWVEEEPEIEAAAPIMSSKPAQTSALEKLREKPPEDLSLVEMVERFAGALNEHQQSERGQLPAHGPSRDAALAEALKALTLFTERGFDQPITDEGTSQLSETERDLRDALSKLQTLRGAA